MKGFQECSVQQLADTLQQGPNTNLIDVRTPLEFQEVHVPEARNFPLDRLTNDAQLDRSKPLYVICKSGGRASQACAQLAQGDFDQLFLVEGGTDAWVTAGLPVVRGKKAMSLERQVRIAAGSLVLTGVIVGMFLHPAGFALSAFVGAGLIFAGVTDTCGMGMLLAKMPWNNVAGPTGNNSSKPDRGTNKENGQCTIPS